VRLLSDMLDYFAPKPAPLESRKAARLAMIATVRMRAFFT